MLRPYTTRLRQKSHVQQRCHSTAAYAQTVPELFFCFWQAYGNDRTQAHCPSLVHERSHKQQTACDPRGKTLSISALARFYPYWKSKSIFPLCPRHTLRRRPEKPYFHGCQRPAWQLPPLPFMAASAIRATGAFSFRAWWLDRQTTSTVPQVTTARYAGLVAKKR